jgi:carboxymethylenebutenolidase
MYFPFREHTTGGNRPWEYDGMTEQPIEIATPDGVAGGFLYRPQDQRRLPGVLYLTDIVGIRDSFRPMAQRMAEQGYTVLMPNIFYRFGNPPIFDFPFRMGDERFLARRQEIIAPLTPEAVERDAAGYVDWLTANPSTAPGPMGVVGYCFSGAMAMRVAATRPDRIAALASFHGGRLYVDGPDSPHLLLPRIKARLYFGHAEEDKSMPPESIDKFNQAMNKWGGFFESEIYAGAHHGWTVPDSPAYNHDPAERTFQKLIRLLAATLEARSFSLEQ